jgi:hypothetical protein
LAAALAFAHLALAAAAIRARPAALSLRFPFFGEEAPLPFILAQRALWAALIFARVAADLLYLAGLAAGPPPPKTTESSRCRASIFSLIATARRSCSVDISVRLFFMAVDNTRALLESMTGTYENYENIRESTETRTKPA